MMRVADYIADFLAERLKIDRVFMVSGGGMMFLSDGLAACTKLRAICSHHEQAAAMGAVGYAKYRNGYGAAMVTTGCGGTNALTGLLNAWQDSARVFFISGQCKRAQTVRNCAVALRQFGVQEADIIGLAQQLTKYAVMVNQPEKIAYELEKAAWLAGNGRPGPVWIDVPMDVQSAEVDESELEHFLPPEDNNRTISQTDFAYLQSLLIHAERPVVLAGQGIDLADSRSALADWVSRMNLPVVTSFLGGNVIAGTHPNYIGRIGNKGSRAGNLTVQNADLLLVLGCRLSVSSTGHEYGLFARKAKIVVVDVDSEEHRKNTVRVDRFIESDVRQFFAVANTLSGKCPEKWLSCCQEWKRRYPIIGADSEDDLHGISLYGFMKKLNQWLKEKARAAVVSDAGSSFYVATQALEIDENQRYITSGGQAEMGFSLPAAIGAAAVGAPLVAAITGDGSLQMNIQELQTLKHYGFPVKLFVWNNNGYLSIRATQKKFFNGRFIGTDAESGVSFPNLKKIADAYEIAYCKVERFDEFDRVFRTVFADARPVICEIMCNPDQEIVPSVSSCRTKDGRMKSLPLEDMYPFLDWSVFCNEMIIDPIERE